MHQILCSTGALIGRPNGRDYRLLAQCVDHLQCDGYEFMLYDTWYDQIESIAGFLSSLSLHIPVMHCEKRIGEWIAEDDEAQKHQAYAQFDINCQLASFLHADRLVMHLWNGQPSDGHFERHLAAYEKLLSIAQKHQIELLIENVVCAYQDPMRRWEQIWASYPGARFTYDTKMAAFHDQMDDIYLPQYRHLWDEGKIAHLHVNDYGGGYMDWKNLRTLPIGKGNIDFDRFFSFLNQVAYRGDYTVEATAFLPDGIIRCAPLNDTFSWIRDHTPSKGGIHHGQ